MKLSVKSFMVLSMCMVFLAACGGTPVSSPPSEITAPSATPCNIGKFFGASLGTIGSPYPPLQFNTEQYNKIDEIGFRKVLNDPLSTFSIDVDTASYANVRRFLNDNRLPPKDSVRIEEMINYFSYNYREPSGNDSFSVITEMSDCPWHKTHKLVHIGIKAKDIHTEKIPASNLVFLLDVSGSMSMPDKLPLLKKGMRLLVDKLRKTDRVAIVVYAGAAGLVLDSTPANEKAGILKAIESLQAGGSTAGGEGIKLAYQVAKENFIKDGNNRVILATDGDFNVGVSSDGELVRMVEEKRKCGVFLTVLGFGTGNIKDSKMEKLADKGNGNYAYIDSLLEAKKVLVKEMGATLFTIAKDVKIQVEFNPAKVQAYRLVGYENRMLNKEDFKDDRKDAGELGAGHTVTALYEIISAESSEQVPTTDDLKYQSTTIKDTAKNSGEIITIKLRFKAPEANESSLKVYTVKEAFLPLVKASDNFKFSAAVAAFGMLLRDSEFKGTATYNDVIKLARESKGQDKEGYRAEFIRLVEQAEMLDEKRKD